MAFLSLMKHQLIFSNKALFPDKKASSIKNVMKPL